MDGQSSANVVSEMYLYRVPKVDTKHQQLNLLHGLRRCLMKSPYSLLLHSLRILFKNIHKAIGIIISVLIIDNGYLNRFYIETPGLTPSGILAQFHILFSFLLSYLII